MLGDVAMVEVVVLSGCRTAGAVGTADVIAVVLSDCRSVGGEIWR